MRTSNCCNATDRLQPITEVAYSEIGICPKCKEGCEFDGDPIKKIVKQVQLIKSLRNSNN